MIRQMVRDFATVLLALFATDIRAADFVTERREMLEEIKKLTVATGAETGRTTLEPRVLDAMGRVQREEFMPPQQAGSAYKSRALSIGHGQTISQPFIVALMTELLQLKPTDTVLEVGTGSGYQAAVLSLLARQVYTRNHTRPRQCSGRNARAAWLYQHQDQSGRRLSGLADGCTIRRHHRHRRPGPCSCSPG